MSRPTWPRVVLWLTVALSGFALAYVAYVHVLASSRRMSPEVREFRDGFGEGNTVSPSYAVRTRGELVHSVRRGVLTVEGAGHAGDEIRFAMPARRFDDSVLTLRVRVPADAAVEAFLGFEQAGTARTVTAALVGGPLPFVHLGGDTSSPLRGATAVEDVAVEAAAGEWHTLSVQFAPVFSLVNANLDGRPLMSLYTGWSQGTEARVVFGVRLRGEATRTSVEMESIGMKTLDLATLRSFDERFSGEFVDFGRWSFQFPDRDLAETVAKVEKGSGLRLDGTAHAMVLDPTPLFLVRSFPFPLRSLHVRADVTVDDLDEASLFVGLMGASLWSSPGRIFDAGVTRRNGKANAFVAGAWTGTGVLTFDQAGDVQVPHRLAVDLHYDAQTSIGFAEVDGRRGEDHYLELKPLDLVALRIGAVGHGPRARAGIRIHRVSIETQ